MNKLRESNSSSPEELETSEELKLDRLKLNNTTTAMDAKPLGGTSNAEEEEIALPTTSNELLPTPSNELLPARPDSCSALTSTSKAAPAFNQKMGEDVSATSRSKTAPLPGTASSSSTKFPSNTTTRLGTASTSDPASASGTAPHSNATTTLPSNTTTTLPSNVDATTTSSTTTMKQNFENSEKAQRRAEMEELNCFSCTQYFDDFFEQLDFGEDDEEPQVVMEDADDEQPEKLKEELAELEGGHPAVHLAVDEKVDETPLGRGAKRGPSTAEDSPSDMKVSPAFAKRSKTGEPADAAAVGLPFLNSPQPKVASMREQPSFKYRRSQSFLSPNNNSPGRSAPPPPTFSRPSPNTKFATTDATGEEELENGTERDLLQQATAKPWGFKKPSKTFAEMQGGDFRYGTKVGRQQASFFGSTAPGLPVFANPPSSGSSSSRFPPPTSTPHNQFSTGAIHSFGGVITNTTQFGASHRQPFTANTTVSSASSFTGSRFIKPPQLPQPAGKNVMGPVQQPPQVPVQPSLQIPPQQTPQLPKSSPASVHQHTARNLQRQVTDHVEIVEPSTPLGPTATERYDKLSQEQVGSTEVQPVNWNPAIVEAVSLLQEAGLLENGDLIKDFQFPSSPELDRGARRGGRADPSFTPARAAFSTTPSSIGSRAQEPEQYLPEEILGEILIRVPLNHAYQLAPPDLVVQREQLDQEAGRRLWAFLLAELPTGQEDIFAKLFFRDGCRPGSPQNPHGAVSSSGRLLARIVDHKLDAGSYLDFLDLRRLFLKLSPDHQCAIWATLLSDFQSSVCEHPDLDLIRGRANKFRDELRSGARYYSDFPRIEYIPVSDGKRTLAVVALELLIDSVNFSLANGLLMGPKLFMEWTRTPTAYPWLDVLMLTELAGRAGETNENAEGARAALLLVQLGLALAKNGIRDIKYYALDAVNGLMRSHLPDHDADRPPTAPPPAPFVVPHDFDKYHEEDPMYLGLAQYPREVFPLHTSHKFVVTTMTFLDTLCPFIIGLEQGDRVFSELDGLVERHPNEDCWTVPNAGMPWRLPGAPGISPGRLGHRFAVGEFPYSFFPAMINQRWIFPSLMQHRRWSSRIYTDEGFRSDNPFRGWLEDREGLELGEDWVEVD